MPRLVNTFFRSALFPLIVVVLLVYLASQTLLGESEDTTEVPYSELVGEVRRNPTAVREVVFRPNRHEVVAELSSGAELESSYPTASSQVDFERYLSRNGVTFDYDWSDASSPWWSLLTALLPFVLLFGFWIALTKRRHDPS